MVSVKNDTKDESNESDIVEGSYKVVEKFSFTETPSTTYTVDSKQNLNNEVKYSTKLTETKTGEPNAMEGEEKS